MKPRHSLLAALSAASALAFATPVPAYYSWSAFSYDPGGAGWAHPTWWGYSNWGDPGWAGYRYGWIYPNGYPYGWSQFQYWSQPNLAPGFWFLPLTPAR